MKYLQRLSILLITSAAIFSCQKEYSVENPPGINPAAQWSFSEGSAQFKGPFDTTTIDTVGRIGDPNTVIVLSMSGHSDDKKDLISLSILGPKLTTGSYKIPNSLFAYSHNGIISYQTNITDIDSFTVVVNKLDSTGISGTFSGKAYDTAKARKSIVNGVFSAVFKTSVPVTPPSTDSGNVVLWSKAGCGGGTSTSPISIKINGKDGQITKFSSAEPTVCDSTKGYSVKLPVGNYPWVAKCGTDSVTGTITVTNGGCTKMEVDFTAKPATDYFPITTNSNWNYLKEASTPDDTLFTISTGTTKTLNGKTYNIFRNDYGGNFADSQYYRKAPGLYYEYFSAGDATGMAVGVEHIFLKDNVAASTGWLTPFTTHASYKNPLTGATVDTTLTGMIYDTLTSKLTTYQASAALPTYNDVLEVHTGYYITSPLGNQLLFYSKQWFAKGVGSVRYYEFDSATPTSPAYNYTINLTRSKIY